MSPKSSPGPLLPPKDAAIRFAEGTSNVPVPTDRLEPLKRSISLQSQPSPGQPSPGQPSPGQPSPDRVGQGGSSQIKSPTQQAGNARKSYAGEGIGSSSPSNRRGILKSPVRARGLSSPVRAQQRASSPHNSSGGSRRAMLSPGSGASSRSVSPATTGGGQRGNRR